MFSEASLVVINNHNDFWVWESLTINILYIRAWLISNFLNPISLQDRDIPKQKLLSQSELVMKVHNVSEQNWFKTISSQLSYELFLICLSKDNLKLSQTRMVMKDSWYIRANIRTFLIQNR